MREEVIEQFNMSMAMSGSLGTDIIKRGKYTLRIGDINTQELKIPEGVEEIVIRSPWVNDDGKSIKINTVLEKVHIPTSVKFVGASAFMGYKNLQEVAGGQNVECLGYHIFKDCSRLKSISMPNVYLVQEGAFYNCINLQEVTLGVCARLCYLAFYSCNELHRLTGGIYDARDNAFRFCKNLTEIELISPDKKHIERLGGVVKKYAPFEDGAEFRLMDVGIFNQSNLKVIKAHGVNSVKGQFIGATSLEHLYVPDATEIWLDGFRSAVFTRLKEIHVSNMKTIWVPNLDTANNEVAVRFEKDAVIEVRTILGSRVDKIEVKAGQIRKVNNIFREA